MVFELLARQIKDANTAGLRTCTAESLTGGMVSNALVQTSGSSAYHLGGVCAYNIDVKVNLLGVSRDHAAEVDCVSSRVAVEMADGALKLFEGADIAIATTGYAGPYPEEGVTDPYAWVCVMYREQKGQGNLRFTVDHKAVFKVEVKADDYRGRVWMQDMVTSRALNALRILLLELNAPEEG